MYQVLARLLVVVLVGDWGQQDLSADGTYQSTVLINSGLYSLLLVQYSTTS